MELKEYLAVLTRRWRTVVAVVVLGLLAAGVTGFLMPPSYTAEAQLFVSTTGAASDASQLAQGSDFSQQRVKSYAELATSPKVTQPVVAKTGLAATPAELASKISADAPLNTVLINLDVTDSSPQVAAKLANAVADQLGKLVQQIETPPGIGSASPVKASVVRQASPPRQADAPRLPMILGLGLLAGLAVGIGLGILRESMDTRVKGGEQLTAVTGLPVLGTIARDKAAKDSPVVRGAAGGPRLEAFRQLRTNLQYADVDKPPRTIVVTSAVPDEGKTSVAGNLAVAMSQLGLTVCLVDADLRRGSVADYFGLIGEAGLTTALVGRATLRDVLQPAGGGLDVLAGGEIPPNPSELLGSERMSVVLRELSLRYDMVLLDAPPVLPVTDAAVLARSCEAALLVVRTGKTTRGQVADATSALQQVGARVLGGVLNMVPAGRRDSYDYGYGYGHQARHQAPPEQPPAAEEPATQRFAGHLAEDSR